MRIIVASIEAEWRRYKVLAESAIAQVRDEELGRNVSEESNSIAVIVAHIAGNLKSRFSDFLTSDGEKPWRDRDSEFQPLAGIPRNELMTAWEQGWKTLFSALAPLTDADLSRTVSIRGETFLVHEALHRLLPHTSYHVGQIVYLAKAWRAADWKCLSIPLGKSREYNLNPVNEKPPKG